MEHDENQVAHFSANLRLLCERHGSISAVCRKINLNRQQFNKYLSGLHMPSPQNLRLIANYFGLSVPILFSQPDEFRTLVEGNFFHAMENVRRSPELNKFVEAMIVESSGDQKEVLGVWDRYQYSSIYKGFVLRSAFCIYKNNQFLQHYYIERFPSYDDPTKTEYVFKYYGFVFPVAGRLFTADFEGIQRNELTFGVYAPVKRSSSKFMFGIATGIAATMFRQPYSTKVALHYRGPGLLKREHLDALTVLDRGDPSIPREALQFLGDGSEMIQLG
ncbi:MULTISPECIES: helix-turn-helix transcriptional regulator [Mesorhizobium]|jgi:transcriptional regulator with XRE-family HTH domain|uniref:helix-turn-helix domain-containing protein n=1 Tax=Mesorhizobium TaxID=68287 RepID=UPI0007ED61B8|nr:MULTISPECIES: helix-turn-helix transcriptional regulator [Mesorhizobium]MCF6113131.1 helix-turn-helix transcriptional regulator [Mesorhizobium muleiense]MCV3205340.1 helix-turn-helix transcriptional regulator [Mesorhizobium sp. YC-2]MCV3228261.1 helix-turn-helix transcriptional regulator [Mesorhizobium sp. YC-39]PBB52943.1 XRE family transcriptional regulator [Mesorhizobium loti]QIA22522.1 helix-turn-helix transcriptional regulator [Mesorhizobium sp. AA22]